MNLSPKIKEHNDYSMCKSHSTRTEKDNYRISPSKLNKQELEDLYFTIIENNLQLKKTVNAQHEQIKILSTRIQRITAQRSIYGKYDKKCCTQSKVLISQHEDVISELKLANEKLAEKVRTLNMRLCSAKQFLKHSPLQISKCHNYSSSSFRNVSKPLNDKQCHPNLTMKSTSSQYLNQDVTPLMLEDAPKQTVADQGECSQGRCRATVEQLQQEVSKLNKELSQTDEDYTRKIAEMEEELSGVKERNLLERAQSRAAEDEARRGRSELQQARGRLRDADARNENATLELALARQSVLELRAELRAAELRGGALRTPVNSMTLSCHVGMTGAESGDAENPRRPGDGEKKCISVSDQIDDLQVQLEAMKLLTERGAGDNLAPHEARADGGRASIAISSQNHADNAKCEGNNKNTNRQINKPNRRKNRIKKLKENNKILNPLEIADKKEMFEANDSDNDDAHQCTDVKETDGFALNEGIDVDDDDDDALGYKIKEDYDDIENYKKHFETKGSTEIGKTFTYKDIGIQSVLELKDEKQCVSRAVGAGVGGEPRMCAVEAGVQNDGDSLCEKIEENFDTKTYTRRKQTSATHRTYSVEAKLKTSPSRDNTQCGISSLSDLTADSKSSSNYISPGEERPSTGDSSGTYAVTTSDCELSEGELPVCGHKRSYGEVKVKGNTVEPLIPLSPTVKVGRAIRAARQELSRCGELLRGGRGVGLLELLK